MSVELVVATRNQGKLAELTRLLAGLDLRLLSLEEAGVTAELIEAGATFEENAVSKAEQACALSGRPALADDSGLCVDALGGEPGVRTARFGGPGLTDAERMAHLLAGLADVPAPARSARFVSVVALARLDEPTLTTVGVLEGMIAAEPAGTGGFGYDPVFFVPALGATLAEVPPSVKDALSHRGAALRAMRRILEEQFASMRR